MGKQKPSARNCAAPQNIDSAGQLMFQVIHPLIRCEPQFAEGCLGSSVKPRIVINIDGKLQKESSIRCGLLNVKGCLGSSMKPRIVINIDGKLQKESSIRCGLLNVKGNV